MHDPLNRRRRFGDRRPELLQVGPVWIQVTVFEVIAEEAVFVDCQRALVVNNRAARGGVADVDETSFAVFERDCIGKNFDINCSFRFTCNNRQVAGGRLVEAQDHLGDRALAAAGRADEGDVLAR